MVKTLGACIVLVLLPACSAVPDWFPSAFQPEKAQHSQKKLSAFNFEWELSGSKEVAPLQVFDDGQRTWLQFAPQQPVPAIFELAAGGARPLSYEQEGPYLVLQGVWPQLMFRGGALQAQARRSKSPEASAEAVTPVTPLVQHDVQPVPDLPEPEPALAESGPVLAEASINVSGPAMVDAQSAEALAVDSVMPAVTPSFDVSPLDLTVRAALAKWAQVAGWTFEPEHWVPDVDIPIVGSASFSLPFKQAVQELVASTELADRPLQPCFYSNRVLRVVPYAQPCNRTTGSMGVS